MPAVLVSYTDPHSVEEEATPPFVWLKEGLSQYWSQQKYPQMLLFNPEVQFHKFGYLRKSDESVFFQFDRTSITCVVAVDETLNGVAPIKSLETGSGSQMFPALRDDKLVLTPFDKLDSYERWLGGLIVHFSAETMLIWSSMMTVGQEMCNHAARAALRLDEKLKKIQNGNDETLLGWTPLPKPSGILCWLDILLKHGQKPFIKKICSDLNPSKSGWSLIHLLDMDRRWRIGNDFLYKNMTVSMKGKSYPGHLRKYLNGCSASLPKYDPSWSSRESSDVLELRVSVSMVIDVEEMNDPDSFVSWGFNGTLEEINMFLFPAPRKR